MKKIFLFSVIVIMLFCLMACGLGEYNDNNNNNNDNNNLDDLNDTRQTRLNPADREPNTPDDNMDNMDNMDNRYNADNNMDNNNRDNIMIDNDRAEKIADDLSKLPQIQSVVCFVKGNDAYVGVKTNKNYDKGMTQTLKNDIESKVRAAAPSVRQVKVSTDSAHYKMINDLMNNNKDKNKRQDMSDTIRRLEQDL